MSNSHQASPTFPRLIFAAFVLPGGMAAIGWQLVWQHHASLALGVSAQATALVVATTMAGMMAGALLAAQWLPKLASWSPWAIYAALEVVAAVSGQLFGGMRETIADLDAAVYQFRPGLAPLVLLATTMLVIGPAALAIGATVPVIGLLSRDLGIAVSRLYALNTVGAAIGAVWFPFAAIPMFGVSGCAMAVTCVQLTGALGCWGLRGRHWSRGNVEKRAPERAGEKLAPVAPVAHPEFFAFLTGLATFVLEVTWFRTIRSAWLSTVDSFAIVLFAFLIALAVGAWLARVLRRRGSRLPSLLGIAGLLILPASMAIAHFDAVRLPAAQLDWKPALWLLLALAAMGPPVAVLGVSLPWLLDAARDSRGWGRLYAWNTLGCALGALGAAWLLMPLLGPGQLAWVTGLALAGFSSWWLRAPWRLVPLVFLAIVTLPKDRLTGASTLLQQPHKVLDLEHGPDVTTAVIAVRHARALIIDGYAATGEFGALTGYMDAMGRLPMLLQENPRDALVICVGTGQTAHALRDENAVTVTAVDVNPAVFEFAKHFPSNRDVLQDPKVTAITMDGRAWLRRTEQRYDVVTLEPMPPLFAGTNALYSEEFYRLIASRLRPGGIAAQWFPMHLLSADNARSVVAAFLAVFPDAVLWIDPSNVDPQGTPQQGVLLGSLQVRDWHWWPGLERAAGNGRPLQAEAYRGSIALKIRGLLAFSEDARPVTDDNLILTHGASRHLRWRRGSSPARVTMDAIRGVELRDLLP